MFAVRDALEKLTAELDAQRRSVSDIQAKLQNQSQPKRKTGWDIFTLFVPLIQALALALVGFFLTDSVNRALKERELDLSNVKEMRELLLKLSSPEVTDREAEATAATLTAFGRYAIGPLVHQLQGGMFQSIASERALRVLSTTEPVRVCDSLRQILRNQTQLFATQSYIAAVRLTGAAECRKARPDLEALRLRLQAESPAKSLGRLHELVSPPEPTTSELQDLKAELDRAIRALGG